jgi:hypothetical protein
MASKSEAETFPVAVRAWCVRDAAEEVDLEAAASAAEIRRGIASRATPKSRPETFIALDTECCAPATAGMPGFDGEKWRATSQALLFGVACIGRTRGMRISEEIIFFPDDLPEHGREALREFMIRRTLRLGREPRSPDDPQPERVWRGEPAVTTRLMPLSEFLKVFYRVAYRQKALVIGFNLPFDLARCAARWGEARRGAYAGGWSLELWRWREAASGALKRNRYRPRILIRRAARDVTFIEFAGIVAGEGEQPSRWRGEFLDLGSLAFALTGLHWSLAGACKTFLGRDLDKDVEHGIITADYVAYCRGDVRATVALAGELLRLFDRHPVSRVRGGKLSECHSYSPSGFARAYLKAAGFGAPIVPEDRLGPCAAAFHGGWAEINLRGRAPVVMLDFRKMYQMQFVLQGLQSFIAAERLEFVEATEEVRAFVENATLDTLFRPEAWTRLGALCWVEPAGEILPGKFALNSDHPERFTMAVTPRHAGPTVFFLADVLLAKLMSGRAPKILKAERIAPKGRRRLSAIRLFDGAEFDPERESFFKRNVEESERIDRSEGLDPKVRKALYNGMKAAGNSGAFGIFSETHEDVAAGREEATLLSDGPRYRAILDPPEQSGAFACPPIAGLVTAGGRLMLAMVHRLVMDKGGTVAMGDTDSAAIVATEHGVDDVFHDILGARQRWDLGGCRPLAWADCAEIAARFEPLNPFDRDLLPGSPLAIKAGMPGAKDEPGPVDALVISAKRYSLTRPDGTLAARMESIIGILAPPVEPLPGDDRRAASSRWLDEAWAVLAELWSGKPRAPRPWFDLPAVRRAAISSPAWAKAFAGVPELHPFDFCLAAMAEGRRLVNGKPEYDSRMVIAPFERRPERWPHLPWIFAATGAQVDLTSPDAEEWSWRLRTVLRTLEAYQVHYPRDRLAPKRDEPDPGMLTGIPALVSASMKGPLRRRPVRDGKRWLVLKEGLWAGDDRDLDDALGISPPISFPQPLPAIGSPAAGAPSSWDWADTIRPALAVVGPAAVAREMRVARSTLSRWLDGRRAPGKPHAVAEAIAVCAHRAGLALPGEGAMIAETLCARLPDRAARVQFFAGSAVELLAERYGGLRPLARAIGGDTADAEDAGRSFLRDALALATADQRPLNEISRTFARLAEFARNELRKKRRRIAGDDLLPSPGPMRDRQTVAAFLRFLHGDKPVAPPAAETFDAPSLPAMLLWLDMAARRASGGWRIEALACDGAPGRYDELTEEDLAAFTVFSPAIASTTDDHDPPNTTSTMTAPWKCVRIIGRANAARRVVVGWAGGGEGRRQ